MKWNLFAAVLVLLLCGAAVFYVRNVYLNKPAVIRPQTNTQPTVVPKIVSELDSVRQTQTNGTVTITATKNTLQNNRYAFTIAVDATEGTVFDSIDLNLDLDNFKEAPNCTTGNAFPLYPRVDATRSSIYLMGVASINENTVGFAKDHGSIVTCDFEKANTALPATVSLHKRTTQLYSLGKPVFDFHGSFTEIKW